MDMKQIMQKYRRINSLDINGVNVASRTSAAFMAPVTSKFCGRVMIKVRSVYGRLGLAARHKDSTIDLGQSEGVCTSVNLVLAYSHVFITLLGSPSPNLIVLLNVTKP